MAHRAFVIKLAAECNPESRLCGTVEHVRSGKAFRFANLDEFLGFVTRSVEDEKRIELQEREAAGGPHL